MYYVLLTFGQRCFQGTEEECKTFVDKMVSAGCERKRFLIMSKQQFDWTIVEPN